jgi:hypothetical protein
MDNGGMDRPFSFCFKIDVVVSPVMGQIGPDEDDVSGLKAFDMIAYKLCTAASWKKISSTSA